MDVQKQEGESDPNKKMSGGQKIVISKRKKEKKGIKGKEQIRRDFRKLFLL